MRVSDDNYSRNKRYQIEKRMLEQTGLMPNDLLFDPKSDHHIVGGSFNTEQYQHTMKNESQYASKNISHHDSIPVTMIPGENTVPSNEMTIKTSLKPTGKNDSLIISTSRMKKIENDLQSTMQNSSL